MEGWGWQQVHDPEALPHVIEGWKTSLATGEPFEMEFPLRGADGRFRPFLTRGHPLKDAQGRVLQWLGTNTDISERIEAEERIKKLNAELEERVQDRTRDLTAANKELEAFCYSVSHDLRAPLRTMDGFSQAVLEDYAERLDAEGQGYLQRIRRSCQRMGQLIDDLLNLSRLSRAELHRQSIDLTALAREAARQLQQTQPDRHVTFRIADHLTAEGDLNLLRAVLWNLLENAWKFTARRPEAVIEFGVQDGHAASAGQSATGTDCPVFFVRDNGAGFDMAYAGKLFRPFQRLHRTSEFPGSGIGLANVQRIIHRHGGRLWAEGAVGHGATVYFTIEPTKEEAHGS